MIRLRIFHPGRCVWRVRRRRGAEEHETWYVLHAQPPDWARILGQAFHLMWIPATVKPDGILLEGDAGRIFWRGGRRWTKMTLQLRAPSTRKQQLMVAALLKAARFQQ